MPDEGLDMSEVHELAADLVKLAETAVQRARPIVERGALNVKTQMVADMRSSPAFKGTARSISYDVRARRGAVEAEVGPDKARRGALANVAYFGTPRGGGTVADPLRALAAEAPSLLRYLSELVEVI